MDYNKINYSLIHSANCGMQNYLNEKNFKPRSLEEIRDYLENNYPAEQNISVTTLIDEIPMTPYGSLQDIQVDGNEREREGMHIGVGFVMNEKCLDVKCATKTDCQSTLNDNYEYFPKKKKNEQTKYKVKNTISVCKNINLLSTDISKDVNKVSSFCQIAIRTKKKYQKAKKNNENPSQKYYVIEYEQGDMPYGEAVCNFKKNIQGKKIQGVYIFLPKGKEISDLKYIKSDNGKTLTSQIQEVLIKNPTLKLYIYDKYNTISLKEYPKERFFELTNEKSKDIDELHKLYTNKYKNFTSYQKKVISQNKSNYKDKQTTSKFNLNKF